jgi:hypothetical protein
VSNFEYFQKRLDEQKARDRARTASLRQQMEYLAQVASEKDAVVFPFDQTPEPPSREVLVKRWPEMDDAERVAEAAGLAKYDQRESSITPPVMPAKVVESKIEEDDNLATA